MAHKVLQKSIKPDFFNFLRSHIENCLLENYREIGSKQIYIANVVENVSKTKSFFNAMGKSVNTRYTFQVSSYFWYLFYSEAQIFSNKNVITFFICFLSKQHCRPNSLLFSFRAFAQKIL